MISINSVTISTPSSFQVGIMDLTKAERNANGTMIIERIATKRKIEMSWTYLSSADLSTLLTAIGTNIFFTVAYPDPVTESERTGTFYVGDRKAGAIDYQNGVVRWKDIGFNFIEQ